MDITLKIDVDELSDAYRIAGVGYVPEVYGGPVVRLRQQGGRRTWSAMDERVGAYFVVDCGLEEIDIGIPRAVLYVVFHDQFGSDEATVRINDEGDGRPMVEVSGLGTSARLAAYSTTAKPMRELDPMRDGVTAAASVIAGALYEALILSTGVPDRYERDEDPPNWRLAVESDAVVMTSHWRSHGEAVIRVRTDSTAGSDEVQIEPVSLQTILTCFDSGATVALSILNDDKSHFVMISDLKKVAFARLPLVGVARVRPRIERVIQEVCGASALVRDKDGDYPLDLSYLPIYARLVETGSCALQVFAVVLSDVDASIELLKELNDLNVHCAFTRVIHVEHQVLIETDLAADDVDDDTLRDAMSRVRRLANDVTPLLRAVFGGNVGDGAGADDRNELYRQAVIEAEVTPGVLIALNGPDGVPEWPSPEPVYVITGWYPRGVALSPQESHLANRSIALAIVERGGKFVHGHGRSPDGSHVEPSLVAWGISETAARNIGLDADQDAVFRVDEHHVSMLSCADATSEQWSRLP